MNALKNPLKRMSQQISALLINQVSVSQTPLLACFEIPVYPQKVAAANFHSTHLCRAAQAEISAPKMTTVVDSLAAATEDRTVTEHEEPDTLYHMIEIEIRGSEPAVLQSYNKFISTAADHLNLTISHNEVGQKPHLKRWTVLKSVFVHKKHMVQYEVRTYHHKLQLVRLTGSTADTFLEYIQRNLPEGVAMRVGRVRMEKLPEHLLSPPAADGAEPTYKPDLKGE